MRLFCARARSDAAGFIFPSGLLRMYERTGWNVVGHNRAWDVDNVYDVKNGGKYDMLRGTDPEGHEWSVPLHARFWDDLFEHDQRSSSLPCLSMAAIAPAAPTPP